MGIVIKKLCCKCNKEFELKKVSFIRDEYTTAFESCPHCGKRNDTWLHIEAKTDNFNNLTPAELERLALLFEECGEVIQAAGKIVRHGYESTHPDGGQNNRLSLQQECGDVRHAMIRLCDAGDLEKTGIHHRALTKSVNVKKYLHHQDV